MQDTQTDIATNPAGIEAGGKGPEEEIVHWHQRPSTPCGVPRKRELPCTSQYEEVTCPKCAAQVVGKVLGIPRDGVPETFPIQPTPVIPERTPPQRHPAVTTIGEFLSRQQGDQ